MTKIEILKERIVDLVNSNQGMKGVELATKLAVEFLSFETGDIVNAIQACVDDQLIVEVEYTLVHMSYRIKSFYLPAGTIVRINNG